MNKRFLPLIDKLFWWISIPTSVLMLALTVLSTAAPIALFIIIVCDILVAYFLVSPLFGYVELRDKCVFIKFGFFICREIPYDKIRGVEIVRKFYSDSMISLKNSIEHVNIKYNRFDVISVSVKKNDELIRYISQTCEQA